MDNSGVFISYRRDDSRSASGRLYDWMRIAFGRQCVFRDVASMGAGKWREKIDKALVRSKACISVIGPRWLSRRNARRLFESEDQLHHELRTALSLPKLTLVPTLVEGAVVPGREALPEDIRPLLDWQVFALSDEGWEDDVKRLRNAIAEVTGLKVLPEFDRLMNQSEQAESHVRGLEREKKMQADQIQSLLGTVRDLVGWVASAEEPDSAKKALAAWAKGNPREAEAEFERLFAARSALAERAAREAAEAARNVANLAQIHDATKAVHYYGRASELDSNDPQNWRLLGSARRALGDSKGAHEAFLVAVQKAQRGGDSWEEMAASVRLGNCVRLRGRFDEALKEYKYAMKIAKARREEAPHDVAAKRDLSMRWLEIGDVQKAKGNLDAAATSYRASLKIARALAEHNPKNATWQRDVGRSCARLGKILAINPNQIERGRGLIGKGIRILKKVESRRKPKAS